MANQTGNQQSSCTLRIVWFAPYVTIGYWIMIRSFTYSCNTHHVIYNIHYIYIYIYNIHIHIHIHIHIIDIDDIDGTFDPLSAVAILLLWFIIKVNCSLFTYQCFSISWTIDIGKEISPSNFMFSGHWTSSGQELVYSFEYWFQIINIFRNVT